MVIIPEPVEDLLNDLEFVIVKAISFEEKGEMLNKPRINFNGFEDYLEYEKYTSILLRKACGHLSLESNLRKIRTKKTKDNEELFSHILSRLLKIFSYIPSLINNENKEEEESIKYFFNKEFISDINRYSDIQIQSIVRASFRFFLQHRKVLDDFSDFVSEKINEFELLSDETAQLTQKKSDSAPSPLFQWNGNINVLGTLLFDLIRTEEDSVIGPNLKLLVPFETFYEYVSKYVVDKNGANVNLSTIKSLLNSSKDHLRVYGKKRIKIPKDTENQ